MAKHRAAKGSEVVIHRRRLSREQRVDIAAAVVAGLLLAAGLVGLWLAIRHAAGTPAVVIR